MYAVANMGHPSDFLSRLLRHRLLGTVELSQDAGPLGDCLFWMFSPPAIARYDKATTYDAGQEVV